MARFGLRVNLKLLKRERLLGVHHSYWPRQRPRHAAFKVDFLKIGS